MRCGLIFVERNVGENSDFAEKIAKREFYGMQKRQTKLIQKRATKRWLKIFKRNAILKIQSFSKRSEKKKRPAKTSRFQESSGIEPLHRGFADLSLTTWVRLHIIKEYQKVENVSSCLRKIINDLL